MRLSRLLLKFVDTSVIERDILRLTVKSGTGGQGLPRYNGVGGDGGSVYVTGRRGLVFRTLFNNFKEKKSVKAEHGQFSSQIKLIGQHGAHVYLALPLGAECVNADTNQLICRCTNAHQRILIARGGKGGCASNDYKGQPGEHLTLNIHMKLHPNIGLIGFPNAGKSTLLKALAPEKKSIKIAPYPFTTTKPQMLDVRFAEDKGQKDREDGFTLSCCDLPGIIEGAAMNRGRGHAFLKHLEYSDIILMVVDVQGFQLSMDVNEKYRSALETIGLINKEVEAFDKKILKKPTILVLNKTDLPEGEEKAEILRQMLVDGDSAQWVKHLPAEMRPAMPFRFRAVVKASAKNMELGGLKKTLQKTYEEVHAPRDLDLRSEFEKPSSVVLQ